MDIIVQVDSSALKRLPDKANEIQRVLETTISEVIQKVFAESQVLVPVDTGALKASGRIVRETDRRGKATSQYVTYGNDNVTYAVQVHEDMGVRHTAPTRAKYLEVPLMSNAPLLKELLTQRIALILSA
ncbi:MAG: hypothetical protein EBR81_16360 [Proteobacteria bacterium]|nr:hypothetical protein [Pseudomonadota bacterium]